MSSKLGIELFDARRWSLTARMTVFFGAAIAVIVMCVSVLMYAELVEQLHAKEMAELKDDLRIQQEVLGTKTPTHWQNEWREQQEEYQLFAWQLVAADGMLLAASSNAGAFADGLRATAGDGRFVRIGGAGRVFLRYGEAAHGRVLRGILDVSKDEQVLQRYRTKLLGVVVLAILVSVAIGWLLARRGLAPVRAISAEIGRVNAERLHSRIAQEA